MQADAGGLAQSFRAWSDRFDSDRSGKKYDNYLLPGLDYTREQLFYIGALASLTHASSISTSLRLGDLTDNACMWS